MTASLPRRRHALLPVGLLAVLLLAASPVARAKDDQSFGAAQRIGGGTGTLEFGAGPAALSYGDRLWVYATATDGSAHYASYDGKAWSSWQGWDDQPAKVKWEAAPVEYHDDAVVFWAGEDGKLYHNRYDGKAWAGWDAAAGGYAFAAAPYATTYGDDLDLYAVAADGTLYEASYDGTDWTDWGPVSAKGKAGAYQPYALDWGDHENVLWTGTDGKVYWNRYDGKSWGTPAALAGNGTYADAPYAVGYHGDLDAYATGKDGAPYANVFDGEKWGGWTAYEQAPPAEVGYQPHADAKGDAAYVAYAGTDDHAYAAVYDGKVWSQWQDLGGNHADEPYLIEYKGDVYLLSTGKDGAAYYAVYGKGGGGY